MIQQAYNCPKDKRYITHCGKWHIDKDKTEMDYITCEYWVKGNKCRYKVKE